MDTLAILVAAGRGLRMNAARPKAFVHLAGESLLLRSARALAAYDEGLAIFRRLVETDTDNAEWQHDISVALDKIGYRVDAGPIGVEPKCPLWVAAARAFASW